MMPLSWETIKKLRRRLLQRLSETLQLLRNTPDKVADMQALGFKLSGVEQEINFERTKLLNKINLGFIRQDTDMVDSAFEAIIKFNGKYPRYGIKPADLTDSIKKRAKQRAESVSGVILTEKFLSTFRFSLRATRATCSLAAFSSMHGIKNEVLRLNLAQLIL